MKYFLIFSFVSALTFAILYFLTLAAVYNYDLGIFIRMNGLSYTILTIFMSVIISFLYGLYASLLAFRINALKNTFKLGAAGIASISAGVIGTGCPMCGSIILGAFGAPLGLLLFPLKGLELKILSILILLLSVFLLSKNPTSCKKRKA
jgi:hypothetical protein